jgi:hypothetical protein
MGDDVRVWRALYAERANVNSFVTGLDKKIDSTRRQPRVCEEAHRLRAKRVELVLGESCGVGEGLADIVFFEVRQVGDDLRRCHAIGNEVDDVRDRDAQPTDGRSGSQ